MTKHMTEKEAREFTKKQLELAQRMRVDGRAVDIQVPNRKPKNSNRFDSWTLEEYESWANRNAARTQ